MSDIFDLFKKISSDTPKSAPPEYLVAGLGNPEAKYACTRHNAGFAVIDRICAKYTCKVDRSKFSGLIGNTTISGKSVLLLKPLTYMNKSGISLSAAANFYKIPHDRIIVIADDVSLDVGKMRIRRKGSAGGHNGLKSIIEYLGGDDFIRIKMGVGNKPFPEYNLADWVLGDIPKELRPLFIECADRAILSLELIISGDIDAAMNRYNS